MIKKKIGTSVAKSHAWLRHRVATATEQQVFEPVIGHREPAVKSDEFQRKAARAMGQLPVDISV
jgi:hypothetical protein